MRKQGAYSVFYKDDAGELFHTYSTYGRGVKVMIGTYNLLGLTPLGRNEQDVPHKMAWVRHYDRYAAAPAAGSCGATHGRAKTPNKRLHT